MTPHEFLEQHAENVERALTETLRYDYGPKPTADYYQECQERLNRVKLAIITTSHADLAGSKLDSLNYRLFRYGYR
jgi:hypothetical protein